jgi:hypothetical protein
MARSHRNYCHGSEPRAVWPCVQHAEAREGISHANSAMPIIVNAFTINRILLRRHFQIVARPARRTVELGGPRRTQSTTPRQGDSICGAMVSMSRGGWHLCLWDFARGSRWHRRWARSADRSSAGALRALLDPSREAIHIFRCRLSSVCISRVFFLQPTRAYARTSWSSASVPILESFWR